MARFFAFVGRAQRCQRVPPEADEPTRPTSRSMSSAAMNRAAHRPCLRSSTFAFTSMLARRPAPGNLFPRRGVPFSRGEIVTTSAFPPSLTSSNPPHHPSRQADFRGEPEARHQARGHARLRPPLRVLRRTPGIRLRHARSCASALPRRSARPGQRRPRLRVMQSAEGRLATDRVLRSLSLGGAEFHRSRASGTSRAQAMREEGGQSRASGVSHQPPAASRQPPASSQKPEARSW